jgi:8-amino-7-oxononanoate synthase
VNFTSALYLGITHNSRHLRWTQLTTGTPAAVFVTAQAREAAGAFATLVRCERALALRSSLHAFVDLFGLLAETPAAVVHDDCVYPIARWGMQRVALSGGLLLPFRHHDPEALARRLLEVNRLGLRACWVVCDGYCPGCARPAPLREYAALVARSRARLLIDDTQAIGLFGRAPSATAPYGTGGGGSVPRWGLSGAPVVVVASLAKAFAAPLAMVAGSAAFIEKFSARSEAAVHCSPPSQADLAAAQRALAINIEHGDNLRRRLAERVMFLRTALRAGGFRPRGGLFPVQQVPMSSPLVAATLQARLARSGIAAVVNRARCTGDVALSFLVTAQHGEAELRHAALLLAAAARGCRGFDRYTSTGEA